MTDDDGVKHSINVVGSSLYEAAALAVHQFRARPWTMNSLRNSTRLEVEVLQATERHVLSVEQLVRWTSRPPRSPQEKIAKDRLVGIMRAQGKGNSHT